jgi:hypothetical protein
LTSPSLLASAGERPALAGGRPTTRFGSTHATYFGRCTRRASCRVFPRRRSVARGEGSTRRARVLPSRTFFRALTPAHGVAASIGGRPCSCVALRTPARLDHASGVAVWGRRPSPALRNTAAASIHRSRRGAVERLRPLISSKVVKIIVLHLPIPIDGFNRATGPSLETVQHGTGDLPQPPGAAGTDTRQRWIVPRHLQTTVALVTTRPPCGARALARRNSPESGARGGNRGVWRCPPRPAHRSGAATMPSRSRAECSATSAPHVECKTGWGFAGT